MSPARYTFGERVENRQALLGILTKIHQKFAYHWPSLRLTNHKSVSIEQSEEAEESLSLSTTDHLSQTKRLYHSDLGINRLC